MSSVLVSLHNKVQYPSALVSISLCLTMTMNIISPQNYCVVVKKNRLKILFFGECFFL